tara:strand:+ start:20850 stop:21221 length:372 start_codon:yes stop_codon:yes gene_type:complete
MDVNKLLTNIADFNLPKNSVNTALSNIDVNNSICFDLSSNRIGIGTVDPSYTIDIRGTTSDIDIHINKQAVGGTDISYNVYESIDLLFRLVKDIHNNLNDSIDLTLTQATPDHYDLYKLNKSI